MGLANQRQCARLPNVEHSALCSLHAQLSTDCCATRLSHYHMPHANARAPWPLPTEKAMGALRTAGAA